MKKKFLVLAIALLSTGLFNSQEADAVVDTSKEKYNWVYSRTEDTPLWGGQYLHEHYFTCIKTEERDRCWWFQSNGKEYLRGRTIDSKKTGYSN